MQYIGAVLLTIWQYPCLQPSQSAFICGGPPFSSKGGVFTQTPAHTLSRYAIRSTYDSSSRVMVPRALQDSQRWLKTTALYPFRGYPLITIATVLLAQEPLEHLAVLHLNLPMIRVSFMLEVWSLFSFSNQTSSISPEISCKTLGCSAGNMKELPASVVSVSCR